MSDNEEHMPIHRKKLNAYVEKFNTSAPIFEIEVIDDCSSIQLIQLQQSKYTPPIDTTDSLSELMAECFSERFDTSSMKYAIDTHYIINRAIGIVQSLLLNFLEKNMPKKNPAQTHLYKWFRTRLGYNSKSMDDALVLYKYIKTCVDKNAKLLEDKKEHLNNILSIMEAMKEKYGNRP